MSRYAMCDTCGHRLRRYRDAWGNWDGETYICDYCSGQNEDEFDDEGIDVYNAALAWLSNGRDEEYTFGYTEEELEDALR